MNVKIEKIIIARSSGNQPRGIDYLPNETEYPILLWEGDYGPERRGGRVSANSVLSRYHEQFVSLGGSWFLPLIERMANGESIPADEIITFGEKVTGKRPQIVFEPMYGTFGPSPKGG